MENKMKRTNLYLTEKQHEAIQREAEEKQITFSERFRQIIENYMEKKKNE